MSIRKTRHIRPFFRRRQQQDRTSASTDPHWLDIWLPRISHFSQFGLFVVTIGGLYFTVLPLYQKALLEEAIARKEDQLANAEISLKDSYARLREFAINEFVYRAGAHCSILALAPPGLRTINEKSAMSPSGVDEIFSINTGQCLKQELQLSKSLKELHPPDLEIFGAHVDRIATAIQAKRESALAEYLSIPQRAKTDPSILNPLGQHSERALAFLSKSQSATWIETNRLSLAVEATQSVVAHGYNSYILEQVATLRSIKWKTQEKPGAEQ